VDSISLVWKQAILRFAVVFALVLAVGFIFFQKSICISTTPSFQFLVTGGTIGISYAAFKTGAPKNASFPLLVWYILLAGKKALENNWLLVLYGSYILAMAGAVYLYSKIASRPFIKGYIQRIFTLTMIIAVVNGLLVVFLGLLPTKEIAANPTYFLHAIYLNVQIGAMIGVSSGLGIEVAEYFDRRWCK